MPIINAALESGQTQVSDSPVAGAIPVYQSDLSLQVGAPSRPTSGLGGVIQRIILTHGRNDDGTVFDATGAAGKFHIVNVSGTSLCLLSEGAKNNTKTDTAIFEVTIPQFYKAGDPINLNTNALFNINGGTDSVKTLQAKCFKLAKDGSSSVDLIATAAQTLTGAAVDYSWTIPGATLTPGDRLLIQLIGIITETANTGTNSTVQVNSLHLN